MSADSRTNNDDNDDEVEDWEDIMAESEDYWMREPKVWLAITLCSLDMEILIPFHRASVWLQY